MVVLRILLRLAAGIAGVATATCVVSCYETAVIVATAAAEEQ